jgi:hypothetical protein
MVGERKALTCLGCGPVEAIPVAYGAPPVAEMEAWLAAVSRGELVMGGEAPSEDAPQWVCPSCRRFL